MWHRFHVELAISPRRASCLRRVMASAKEDALRARLQALRSASSLPPLALATCSIADSLILDVANEVAEECLRAATPLVPCSEAVRPLLEGTLGTLPGDGSKISSSLHQMLVQEESLTARSDQRGRQFLGSLEARRIAATQGLDVFGNRPKEKANAETIVCTNCGISLSASRFAPHLERCMLGKGRKRTRVDGGSGGGAVP